MSVKSRPSIIKITTRQYFFKFSLILSQITLPTAPNRIAKSMEIEIEKVG